MIRKTTTNKNSRWHKLSNIWRNCTNLQTLKQTHASIIVKGLITDVSSMQELIFAAAIALPSTINYAHNMFAQIPKPDVFMWNTMLRGSAQSSNPLLTISLYTQMQKQQILPNHYTFPFILKACSRLSWVNMGFTIHGQIMKYGFESDKFARNSLIYFHANCGVLTIASKLFDDSAKKDVVTWSALTSGYAKRGELKTARQLFDKMPIKDLVSWNVMITGYIKQKDMQNARELFNLVPKRDVVTWNTMISGYILNEEYISALKMYEEMKQTNETPDDVTMLSLLSACAELGNLQAGEKIHREVLDMRKGKMVIFVGNALIDMYAKCGSIEKAVEVFRTMKERDISTWNTIIARLAFHGYSNEAIKFFKEMNIEPNEITYTSVLIACSHNGEVEEGKKYFGMIKNPNIMHYGCMVDVLTRAGLLNEAMDFIENMKIEPNAIIWRTILGACKIHGNVELGRIANEKLIKLRQDHSGDYVLLSNIYASEGQWDGAEKIRKLMDDNGVIKEAGSSFQINV